MEKSFNFKHIEAVSLEKIGSTTEAVRLRQLVEITETMPVSEQSENLTTEEAFDQILQHEEAIEVSSEPNTYEETREVVVKRSLDESLSEIQSKLDANPDARILKLTSEEPIRNCRENAELDAAGVNVPEWYTEMAESQRQPNGTYARTVYSSEGGEDREVEPFASYDGDACRFDVL